MRFRAALAVAILSAGVHLGGATTTCPELLAASPLAAPIRIKVLYSELTGSESVHRLVQETLVPNALGYLTSVLKTRPVVGPLELPVNADIIHRGGARSRAHVCDGKSLPLAHDGTDLVVSVRVASCAGFMSAIGCGRDACGRPVSGSIQICERTVMRLKDRDGGPETLSAALVHEFMHILGFDKNMFHRFRQPGTVDPYGPAVNVNYACTKGRDGRFAVRWGLRESEWLALPKTERFSYRFPGPMVKAVDARGLKAAACRCPVDPAKTYSDEDIEYCLRHPNHCAIAVTSPHVAAAAKEYYGCPTIEGQELENSRASCRIIIESHWKVRTLKSELMNWITTEAVTFVSPMTLALLEDSGWYLADYSSLTAQIPSANYGYKSGCPFVLEKCFTAAGELVDNRVFCRRDQRNHQRCSSDAFRITTCDAGQSVGGVWGDVATFHAAKTVLSAYDYGSAFREPKLELVDYCPTYEGSNKWNCVLGDANSRCLESAAGAPQCYPVACSGDGASYQVKFNAASATCTREGQEISIRDRQLILCRDPHVVCADWKMAHLLPASRFHIVPRAVLLPAPTPAETTPSGARSFTSLHTTIPLLALIAVY